MEKARLAQMRRGPSLGESVTRATEDAATGSKRSQALVRFADRFADVTAQN
jgi:hypothetical protein